MKKLLFVVAAFLFLNITGCYTVIWSPGMDFPTADNNNSYNSTDTTQNYDEYNSYSNNNNNYNYNNNDFYYSEPYFGGYASFYNTPWWYSVLPPVTSSKNSKDNKTNSRGGDASTLRNSGDGRGSTGRGEIVNTPPVTVSNPGNNNSGTSENKTETKNDNPRQSSNSGSVRNNDGSRNDGGRK